MSSDRRKIAGAAAITTGSIKDPSDCPRPQPMPEKSSNPDEIEACYSGSNRTDQSRRHGRKQKMRITTRWPRRAPQSFFADVPHARCRRFQPLVDLDKSAGIERHACLVERDIVRVCDTSHGHKQIAAFEPLLARRRPHRSVDLVSGETVNVNRPSAKQDLDALRDQNGLNLLRDIGIVAALQCRPGPMIVTRLPKQR